MDPIAHTFTGAALAACGLRRATPLATAALVLGANAPDVDAVLIFAGDYTALAHRRGWTHGVLALVLLPFLLTGGLLAWDRCVRRWRSSQAQGARAGPLLALSAFAVLTHPTLDWLNNYGMRWLMPFDGRWSYGDALFIIDPWVWLALGGVLFLGHSSRMWALAGWLGFWALASWLVLANRQVPGAVQAAWLLGLAAVLAARWLALPGAGGRATVERAARAAVIVVAVYMAANVGANVPARAEVGAELAARGIGPVTRIMVAPAPGNPFAGTVVAETPEAYYTGTWRWLARPRIALEDQRLERVSAHDPVVAAAAETLQARRFLTWSRFPYVEVTSNAEGHVVRYRDARYRNGALIVGPTVRLDHELRVVRVR